MGGAGASDPLVRAPCRAPARTEAPRPRAQEVGRAALLRRRGRLPDRGLRPGLRRELRVRLAARRLGLCGREEGRAGLVEGRPPSGGFLRRRRPRRRRRLTGRAGTGRPAAVRVLHGRVLPLPRSAGWVVASSAAPCRAPRCSAPAGQRRIGVASAADTHQVPLPRHVPNGDKILRPTFGADGSSSGRNRVVTGGSDRRQLRGGCPVFLATGFHRATNFCLAVARAARRPRARDPLRGGPRLAPEFVLVPLRPPQQDLVDLQRRRQRLGERRAQCSPFASLSTWQVLGAGELVLARLGDLLESLDRLRPRLALPGLPVAPARTLRVATLSSRSLFRTAACCLASGCIAFLCATCVLDGDADGWASCSPTSCRRTATRRTPRRPPRSSRARRRLRGAACSSRRRRSRPGLWDRRGRPDRPAPTDRPSGPSARPGPSGERPWGSPGPSGPVEPPPKPMGEPGLLAFGMPGPGATCVAPASSIGCWGTAGPIACVASASCGSGSSRLATTTRGRSTRWAAAPPRPNGFGGVSAALNPADGTGASGSSSSSSGSTSRPRWPRGRPRKRGRRRRRGRLDGGRLTGRRRLVGPGMLSPMTGLLGDGDGRVRRLHRHGAAAARSPTEALSPTPARTRTAARNRTPARTPMPDPGPACAAPVCCGELDGSQPRRVHGRLLRGLRMAGRFRRLGRLHRQLERRPRGGGGLRRHPRAVSTPRGRTSRAEAPAPSGGSSRSRTRSNRTSSPASRNPKSSSPASSSPASSSPVLQ